MNDVKMCRRNEEVQRFYVHPTTGFVDVSNWRWCRGKLVSVVSCSEFLFFMMLEEHGACNAYGKMFPTKETFLIIMKTPALARYWWFPNFW